MPRRPAAKPARPYHHGQLREALLDAAQTIFAERGRLEFTLRELARAAGVTHAAPYRHFASKEDVVAALRDRALASLATAERSALERGLDHPEDKVRALGEAYVDFALENPVAFRIVFATSGSRSRSAESYRLLEETLAEARAAGVVRADLTPRELALGAWSLVHGLASLLASGSLPRARAKAATALLSTLFFEGARPRSHR